MGHIVDRRNNFNSYNPINSILWKQIIQIIEEINY
jgi:hypothetical protein